MTELHRPTLAAAKRMWLATATHPRMAYQLEKSELLIKKTKPLKRMVSIFEAHHFFIDSAK